MGLTRPLLRWHGGKWRLAPWIIAQMPPHAAYIEPFGGGASVLLRKERAQLEIYNDLDQGVVNLFRVLREEPDELARACAAFPFCREEFEAPAPKGSPVDRAIHFLARSHMGRGSNGVHRSTGFRSAGRRAGSLPVHNWADLPWVIRETAERLRGVVIECLPAINLIIRNDEPEALFYVDPPYVPETRDAGADYAHEMTLQDHEDLLGMLRQVEGKVILSGYAHPLYDDALTEWRRIEKDTLADQALKRTEVLWMNFEPCSARDLFTADQENNNG